MQGRRIFPDSQGNYPYDQIDAGAYFYWPRGGCWMAVTPNGLATNLKGHTITEHEDKSITVGGSIAVNNGDGLTWHGWLDRGVWREC